MSLTLPSDFTTDIAAGTFRPVVVCELDLTDSSTLYLSSQEIGSWGGNAYTRAVVGWGPMREFGDAKRVTSTRVLVSNVLYNLRGSWKPSDKLTDGRLRLRLLAYDSGGALYAASSFVLFEGQIQKPNAVDDQTFTLDAVGWEGSTVPVPGRTTGPRCSAVFADGIDCNYVGAETACNRRFDSADGCTGRAREHEFLGFRGFEVFGVSGFFPPNIYQILQSGRIVRYQGYEVEDEDDPIVASFEGPGDLLNTPIPIRPDFVVPVLYGRRRITPTVIEQSLFRYFTGVTIGNEFQITFHLISEGEVNEVRDWLAEGEYEENVYSEQANSPPNQLKAGYYYRNGAIGVTGDDSGATDEGAAALRTQNQDPRSALTGGAAGTDAAVYSRSCYATFIQGPISLITGETIEDELRRIQYDVEGIKVQKYTSGGAADGSPVYSRNPIWQLVDLLTNNRYGLGRFITASDIDFSVTKPAADYCDAVISSTEAQTNVTAAIPVASTSVLVDSTAGFYPGQSITIGATGETVEQVRSKRVLVVTTARTYSGGEAVAGVQPRFASDLYLAQRKSASAAISALLSSCRGYIKYDEGKIQIDVERAVASSGRHYKDSSYTQGYGIKADGFRWVTDRVRINKAVVPFDNTSSGDIRRDEVDEVDWDHYPTHQEGLARIDGAAIPNRDQAQRIARFVVDRERVTGDVAEIIVGPGGLQDQKGDRITITHPSPNWVAQECIVEEKEIVGFPGNDELFVKLRVRAYNDGIYSDTGYDGPVEIPSPTLTVNLTLVSNTTEAIVLKWEIAEATPAFVRGWRLYKSLATWGTDAPHRVDQIGRFGAWTVTATYPPRQVELGSKLYFQVAAETWDRGLIYSNELEVVTAGVGFREENWIAGGTFQDATMWRRPDEVVRQAYNPTGNSANTPEDDDGVSDPTNATNGSTADFASGRFDLSPATSEGQVYTFTGAGWTTNVGSVELNCRVNYDDASKKNGRFELYTNIGGAGWVLQATGENTVDTLYSTQLVESIPGDLQVKLRARPGESSFREAGTGNGGVVEFNFTRFAPFPAPYGDVVGGECVLESDDGVTWYGVDRPFPFYRPPSSGRVMRADDPFACRVAVRKLTSSTVDGEVEIGLWNIDTDVRYKLLEFNGVDNDYADIIESQRHYATLFVPSADIYAPLRVYVRTKSTVPVALTLLQLSPGVNAGADFVASPQEQATGIARVKSAPKPASFESMTPPVGPTDYIFVETS